MFTNILATIIISVFTNEYHPKMGTETNRHVVTGYSGQIQLDYSARIREVIKTKKFIFYTNGQSFSVVISRETLSRKRMRKVNEWKVE